MSKKKGDIEKGLDELSKALGAAHGQVVTSLVLKRVSPTIMRALHEQIVKASEKSKELLLILEGAK